MIQIDQYELWFVTGSQHLYGDETLKEVAAHAETIANALSESSELPVRVVTKPVLITPEAIHSTCEAANSDPACAGLIAWMHTFSPAKMWIAGLQALNKPLVHLHTQFNAEIPWSTIDMDFMNTNQSAHGGREFGFICSRLRFPRKVVVGHWQTDDVRQELGTWARAAIARADLHTAKFARIGDNMREVAVTEGDKVAAQMKFGFSVNGYGLGDLVAHVNEVSDSAINALCGQYDESYTMAPELQSGGERRESLRDAAKIELGMRSFLGEGGFAGFTDTFENLHGSEATAGSAIAATDERRLRFWRRRRLEGGSAHACGEGHGHGSARWHFVHGRLHLSFDG